MTSKIIALERVFLTKKHNCRVIEALLSLPVSVHCREGEDDEWIEMSNLIDASPFGARLTITRPTEQGRLLPPNDADAASASLFRL